MGVAGNLAADTCTWYGMAHQKRPVFLYWKKGDPASMEPVERGGAGAVVLGERKKKYVQGTKKSRRKSMNERPRTPSGKGGFNQETRLETDNVAAQHQSKRSSVMSLKPHVTYELYATF